MNYYNPYFYTIPSSIGSPVRAGLFSRLFGGNGITFSSILGGTQKVLNVANQAIPLIQQVRPMMGNAKTVFKVMNEFKKTDTNSKINRSIERNKIIHEEKNVENYNKENNSNPTFFI